MLRVSRSDIWAGYGMSKDIPVERNVAGGERQVAPYPKAKLKDRTRESTFSLAFRVCTWRGRGLGSGGWWRQG